MRSLARNALAFAASLVVAQTTQAQELTTALSTQEIQITSSFTGADVTLFGVVANDPHPPEGGYAIAVTLRGPSQNVAVRRKDRVVGIWINRASETMLSVPAFYALRTSTEKEYIGDTDLLTRNLIGFDSIAFFYQDSVAASYPAGNEFRQAFLRLKEEDGLYSEKVDVEFIGDQVFRTTIPLPANTPVGTYRMNVNVFADGALVATARESLEVARSGGERLMFELSRTQALLYGLASVVLALFVGWLGGLIFRRD